MAAEHDIDVIVRDRFFPPRRLLGFLPDLKPRTIVEVGAAHPHYLSISASFRPIARDRAGQRWANAKLPLTSPPTLWALHLPYSPIRSL